MTIPHNPNHWPHDKRPVVACHLPGFPCSPMDGPLLASDGWSFERFERNGEMSLLPYLRCHRDGHEVEAPLTHFAWVQFKDVP